MKRLFSYFDKRHILRLTVVVICITLNSLVTVAASLFLKALVDKYIPAVISSGGTDFYGILVICIQMMGVYLFSALCALTYNRLMVDISQTIIKRVRNDMFHHLQRLPIKYFDQNEYGDIMSKFTNDAVTLEDFLTRTFPDAVSFIITITGVLITMLFLSPLVTGVVLLSLVGILLSTRFLGKKNKQNFMRQQKTMGALNGFTEESVEGLKTIKVFSSEKENEQSFDKLNNNLYGTTKKASSYANMMMPITGNLGNVQYALIAIFGGVLAIKGIGGLTIGIIAAFLQMNKSFTSSISQLANMVNAISQAKAGMGRIFNLLDEEEETDEGTLVLENPKGHIEFKNVSFSYVEGTPILKDVSFEIKPGTKVALVGSTGAGKTTLASLIGRFYDVDEGEILFDGVNIKEYTKESLRLAAGVVLQDVNLFTESLLENIRFGNREATDEQCISAAKATNVDAFATKLSDGYATVITGNLSGVSGGQRQLISIARAEVAEPALMILDEATSSVDTRTELLINESLDTVMDDRTSLVIAHRLSTIRNADNIIVLENGEIVETGNHDELMNKKGRYNELYTLAFENDN